MLRFDDTKISYCVNGDIAAHNHSDITINNLKFDYIDNKPHQ